MNTITDINKSMQDINGKLHDIFEELDEIVIMSKLELAARSIYEALKYFDIDFYRKLYSNCDSYNDKTLIAAYGESAIYFNENGDYEITVDGNALCSVSSYAESQVPYDKSPTTFYSKSKLYILVGSFLNDFSHIYNQIIQIMANFLSYKKEELEKLLSLKNTIEDFKI